MPLAFVYATCLIIIGILRLIAPGWHGVFSMLAVVCLIGIVISGTLDLWRLRSPQLRG